MALGSETLLALAAAALLSHQPVELRHDHLWKSGQGTLQVSESGIVWREPGEPEHNREWSWDDIQQLHLSPDQIRLLTYEDAKWSGYRDREYQFTVVPEGFAAANLDPLRRNLRDKLVAAIALEPLDPVWTVPVKLHQRFGGSEGELTFGEGLLVYRSQEASESRTWPLNEIELISSSGPYDLTILPREKSGWTRGRRDFRFQFKRPILPSQYQQLWMAVQKANGMELRVTEQLNSASEKENR